MAKAAKSIKDKDQRISFLNDLNGKEGGSEVIIGLKS